MVTETEKETLRGNLEKYEGKVSHMYLDSKGYVTIGVGHLLSTVADAQKLGFQTSAKKFATKEEIKTDFEAVKKQPANRLAFTYKKYTKLTLPAAKIDQLTDKHIEDFEKELAQIYPDFATYPTQVRLALFDLIFNLGMTQLMNKWPTFNSAIKARDWHKAAENSQRKSPVSESRNKYVKDLLETATKDTKQQE